LAVAEEEVAVARARVAAAHAAAAARVARVEAGSEAQAAAAEEVATQLRAELDRWRAAHARAEQAEHAARAEAYDAAAARAADAASAAQLRERASCDRASDLARERYVRSTLEAQLSALTASKLALEADVARLQAWQRSRIARLDRAVDYSLTRRHRCRNDDDKSPPNSSPSSQASHSTRSSRSSSRGSSSSEATHYASCSEASASLSSSTGRQGCASGSRRGRQVTFAAAKNDDKDDKASAKAEARARPRTRRTRRRGPVASSCVSSSGNSAEEDGGADSGEGEKTGSAGLLRTLTATLDRSYEFHRVASPSPGARRSQSAPKHCAPSNFREDREEE
jgi:hypothetical protein